MTEPQAGSEDILVFTLNVLLLLLLPQPTDITNPRFPCFKGFIWDKNVIQCCSPASSGILAGLLEAATDYISRKGSLSNLLSNFSVDSAWPAETWSPPTWAWDFGYRCRSCTLSPVPFTTATLGTPTPSVPLIARQPAISPPCHGCPCGLPSLPQGQGAVATSSSATSGWPASLPGCWGSDTFCWARQWEEGTQLKRLVLSLSTLGFWTILYLFLRCVGTTCLLETVEEKLLFM